METLSAETRARRLRAMLQQIARDNHADLESLKATPDAVRARLARNGKNGSNGTNGSNEEVYDPAQEAAQQAKVETVMKATNTALENLAAGKPIDPVEADDLEAIILLANRPATLVQEDNYSDLEPPWEHLNTAAVRARLQPTLVSIGRVELPLRNDVPYGGTGFVVGPNLLMTNRHVAQEFTKGLGTRELVYTPGGAAIDFGQEQPIEGVVTRLEVRGVVMVHPYWDMALLRVDGLPTARPPLTLSIKAPEELRGMDTVVIGYPAADARNDSRQQNRIFANTFEVKRLQPGKVRMRTQVKSFENVVNAMTHDASTLGGNSGSAVIDVATGHVIGLHFGGVYLVTNYAVPMYELARDGRVVDAGLNFRGTVPAGSDCRAAWARADGSEAAAAYDQQRPVQIAVPAAANSVTWTIPIQITISIGAPGAAPSVAAVAAPAVAQAQETLKAPVIYDDLESRTGYQSNFLGTELPLPVLTKEGEKVVARLDDNSPELKYHRFSVVIHKGRRLALFTASNVDWRPKRRLVNGKKPSRKQLTGLDGEQELWVTDPRIPDKHQLPDVFYTKDQGAFDKGHIVRRDDVAWGDSFEDIQKGNGDTYHVTNCSPQIAEFNRSANGEDNWGDLENLVQTQTKAETVSIFAGPVLADDDSYFHGKDSRGNVSIQIPTKFWKIIVSKDKNGLKAFGFALEQDLSNVPTHDEMTVPPAWQRYLVPIADIEKMLGGLATLDALKKIDAGGSDEAVAIKKQL